MPVKKILRKLERKRAMSGYSPDRKYKHEFARSKKGPGVARAARESALMKAEARRKKAKATKKYRPKMIKKPR